MEFSRKSVKQKLKDRTWCVHSVRPKDKATYKSAVYEVFRLIYDEEDFVVKNFFVCSECNLLLHLILKKDGNSKLTRHKCFKNYLAQKEAASSDDDDVDNDSDDHSDDEEDGDMFISDDDGAEVDNGTAAADNDTDDEEDEEDDDKDDNKDDDKDDDDDDDEEVDEEVEESEVMAQMFSQFSELCCTSGPFSAKEMKPIMPRSFSKENM